MYVGVPAIVPGVTVSLTINGSRGSHILRWGEPFNNLDPIVNYTVSCSGDVTCPPNVTTTNKRLIIPNLTTMTTYTFSVVATNSIGSGEAGVVMITIPPSEGTVSKYFICLRMYVQCAFTLHEHMCMLIHMYNICIVVNLVVILIWQPGIFCKNQQSKCMCVIYTASTGSFHMMHSRLSI